MENVNLMKKIITSNNVLWLITMNARNVFMELILEKIINVHYLKIVKNLIKVYVYNVKIIII